MKYFESPEANLVFSMSIVTQKVITKATKMFDKQEMSPEAFLETRKQILDLSLAFNKEIEKINKKILRKKSHYIPTKGNFDGK